MATDKAVIEPCGAAGYADTSVQVKILQVPARCGANTAVHPPPTAAPVPRGDSAPPKVIPTGQSHQPTSSTITVPGLQTSSPSVVVIAKVAASGGVSANGQPQVTKAVLSQVASINQVTTPGRTVMITVPRPAAPQTVAVTPRLPQPASPQLPANIQIPPGELFVIELLVLMGDVLFCTLITHVYRFGCCYILNSFLFSIQCTVCVCLNVCRELCLYCSVHDLHTLPSTLFVGQIINLLK